MYLKHIIILLILIIQSNSVKLRFLKDQQGRIEIKSYTEEKKKVFSILRKFISQESSKFPKNYDSLITNLGSKTEFKMEKISIKKIGLLKNKLPKEVIEKFKAVKYTKGSVTYDLIKYNVYTGSISVNNFFGIATRLNQNELFYAYIKGRSYADPLQQYNYMNVKSCSRFLFWENCKNNKVPVEREFTPNEINIIKQALIIKFYQVLNTILDLDKQLILFAFKKVSSILKKRPPSSKDLILDTKTFMDLQTKVLSPNINNLNNYGLTNNCIKTISNIINKDKYYTSFYDVLEKYDEKIKIIFGVALRMNNQLIISFIKGTAVSDTYHAVCPLYSPIFKEKQKIVPKRRYPTYYKSLCDRYNKGKDFNRIKRDYEGGLTNDEKRIVSATMFAKMSQFLDNFLKGISF